METPVDFEDGFWIRPNLLARAKLPFTLGKRFACIRITGLVSFIYLRDQKSFFRVVLVLYKFRWDLFYISYVFIYSVFLMPSLPPPSRLKPLLCKYVFRYVIKKKE